MNKKILKFESKERLKELDMYNTLESIGVNENSSFLDYGAGTGIFTIPASEICDGIVYGYDISDDMIQIIKEKIDNRDIKNINLLRNKIDIESIESNSIDNILLVTVYHELNNIEEIFLDFKNLLKKDGKVTIIEFHCENTPIGPSIAHRVPKEDIITEFIKNDYKIFKEKNLGNNFYLISFIK